jgi:hypothetical protein
MVPAGVVVPIFGLDQPGLLPYQNTVTMRLLKLDWRWRVDERNRLKPPMPRGEEHHHRRRAPLTTTATDA